ncbi:hypothetical protein NMG60_11034846 [Bertholletia excelsa]
MALSVESPSPDSLIKASPTCTSSSPMFRPSSDKRFWSALRSRVDSLLENRVSFDASDSDCGESHGTKRMREDSLLLLRGFDSVANSLSQLSKNLENALQGARDLSRPPTITEIYQTAMENSKTREESEEQEIDGENRGLKRKFSGEESTDEQGEKEKSPKEDEGKLKKAKNLAVSMATKAASLSRELKSIKSDLCFMQERCSLLEEENRRLRDGFTKGIRPEEDDLVRLQLEALLAEKSRLANENANLIRENQCLNQLVEYHQITSQDLSDTYENVIRGLCLDFSTPQSPIPEDDGEREGEGEGNEDLKMRQKGIFGLRASLDERFDEEETAQG